MLLMAFLAQLLLHLLFLHLSLQCLQQKQGKSVIDFLQHAKSIADEMGATAKPLAQKDFNVHIFCGLRSNPQVIVPILLGLLNQSLSWIFKVFS